MHRMHRMCRFSRARGSAGFAISALLAASLALPGSTIFVVGEEPAATRTDGLLVVEQRVTGLPDLKPGEALRHRLTLDLRGRRVLLEVQGEEGGTRPLSLSREGANRLIVRLDQDPPEILEINDREKRFRIKRGDLNRLQKERDLQEHAERQLALQSPPAEQRRILEEGHLRLDGERIVEVSVGDRRREVLGYDCQEVTITENGREVIHAWVTEEIAGGSSFYELYRRLGVFSAEVLEKAAELRGLPLKVDFKVVTQAPVYQLSAECTSVQPSAPVSEDAFAVPEGYESVKELPPIVACARCGKDVERAEPGGQYRSAEHGLFYFCSQTCLNAFVRALREERAKKTLESSTRGAGSTPREGGRRAP